MKWSAELFWYFISGILFIAGCTAFGALQKCQENVLAFRGPALPVEIRRDLSYGEINVTLADRDGRIVKLSRTTSRIPTSILELHVTCQIGVFPVRCEVPPGSEVERGAKRILREWLVDTHVAHSETVAETEAAAAAELLEWIERH